jgi:hypothetical protein
MTVSIPAIPVELAALFGVLGELCLSAACPVSRLIRKRLGSRFPYDRKISILRPHTIPPWLWLSIT